MIEGLTISPKKIISLEKGDVLHFMKGDEIQDVNEIYFSEIEKDQIKGWKKHKKMNSTLSVPCGAVKFVFFDSRSNSPTNGDFFSILVSKKKFCKIYVPHGLWMAFKGEGKQNIIINAASITHDPLEQEVKDLDAIKFSW